MKLIIDQLEPCWSRLWVDVEAETQEEAIEKYNRGDYETIDSEVLEWTGNILEEIIMDENLNYIENGNV